MSDAALVRDHMTELPHSVGREQPLSVAAGMMKKYDIRHLPVLDGGALLGMLTDRDLHLIESLEAVDAEQVNALAGKQVFFRMGDFEIPFSAENFVLSFSLPNLYFHATTAYDMARISGVQIGKMDYLGQMRVGA